MIEIGDYLLDLNLIAVVSTPIISLVAVIIYARALKNSTNQNKVLLSQNLKPNFEKEIEFLLKEGNKKGIVQKTDFSEEKITYKVSNTFQGLYQYVRNLTNCEEFQMDRKDKIFLNEKLINSKNYSKDLFSIRHIIYKNSSYARYFKNIELFLEKVENSRLIEEDKYAVKNSLRRLILEDSINFYNGYYNQTRIAEMTIPAYNIDNTKTEWRKLKESHLFISIEEIIKMISR